MATGTVLRLHVRCQACLQSHTSLGVFLFQKRNSEEMWSWNAVFGLQGETRCVRDCQCIRGFLRMIDIRYCTEQDQQGQFQPESLLPGVKASLGCSIIKPFCTRRVSGKNSSYNYQLVIEEMCNEQVIIMWITRSTFYHARYWPPLSHPRRQCGVPLRVAIKKDWIETEQWKVQQSIQHEHITHAHTPTNL